MKPILGCDVSHYQGLHGMSYARYQRLDDMGVRFIGIRATIGEGRDRAFLANLARARKHGWVIAAYHFLQPGDVEAQAEAFAKVVGDLPGWLDVEQAGLTRKHVVRFARRFHQLRPKGFLGVYSSASKWHALTGNLDAVELFDGCWNALWTEKGTDERSDLPPAEPRPRWGGYRDALWWQFGALHDAPHHFIDGNAYYGTLDGLKVALGQRPAIPMDQRPARRRAYNAQLQAIVRAASTTPSVPGQGAAWQDGTTDARTDALEALGELVLADVE